MSSNFSFNKIALYTSIFTTLTSVGSFFIPQCSIISLVFSVISTFMHAFKAIHQYKYLNSINGVLSRYASAAISSLIASILTSSSLLMYPNIRLEWLLTCFAMNVVATCVCSALYRKDSRETRLSNNSVLMSQLLESQRSGTSILQEKIKLAQEQLEESQNNLRDLETQLEAFSLSDDDSNLEELIKTLLDIEDTKKKIETLYNKINQLREELQRLTLEPLLPPPYSQQLRPNETQANSYNLDRNGRPIEVCVDIVSDSISLLKQKLKTLLQNLKIINDKLANETEQPLTEEERNTLTSERDAIVEQIVQTYKDIIKSEATVQLPSYSSICGSKELTVEQA